MRGPVTISARSAWLALGFVVLAGPLVAQLPQAKFSRLRTLANKGDVSKDLVSDIGVRPNQEAPYFLYLVNPGQDQWQNLKVFLTADETLNNPIFTGEVKQLEKQGEIGSNAYVPLTSLRKAAPAPAATPDAKSATEPAKLPAAPIPSKLFIHLYRIEDGKLQKLANDQKPVPIEVKLARPREYLTATEPLVEYDATNKSFKLSIKLNDSKSTGQNFVGSPARVRLDLRPELIPGLDSDSIRDGTLETTVEPGGAGHELSVNKLRLTGSPKPSILAISVDGYERAFVFRTNFSDAISDARSTPAPYIAPLTRIDLPKYSMPGKPISAKLEVFGEGSADDLAKGIVPEFTFFRTVNGKPELLTLGLTGSRDIRLGAQLAEEGELVVSSQVKDWTIPVNTRGVFGKREFEFTLKNATAGDETDLPLKLKSKHTIVLDHTAPEMLSNLGVPAGKDVTLKALPIVYPPPPVEPTDEDECTKKEAERAEKKELLAKLKKEGCDPPPGAVLQLPGKGDANLTPEQREAKAKAKAEEERLLGIPAPLPEKVRLNTKMTLVAEGYDLESEIDKVYFFIGPPPGADNKPTKDTKVFEGAPFVPKSNTTAPGPTGGLYFTTFETPDAKGDLAVGVRFINKAGLVTDKVAELKIVEPPAPPKPKEKPTTGTIKGKVTQGDRPQRGLEVKLYNGKAEVVLQTETDENGNFQFCKVPAGAYRVFATKVSDNMARDTKSVVLKAGKTEETELNLLRR